MNKRSERMAAALEDLLDFLNKNPHPFDEAGWQEIEDEANAALDNYLENV